MYEDKVILQKVRVAIDLDVLNEYIVHQQCLLVSLLGSELADKQSLRY